MLDTNLQHLETADDISAALEQNEHVMICCGRMGRMCIPVYQIMEKLEKEYPQVMFRDLDFDIPAAAFIRDLPQCSSFMGLPFTVYFKKGVPVAATTSIQTEEEIRAILDNTFGLSR